MKLFVQYDEICLDSYHSGEEYGDWSADYSFGVNGVTTTRSSWSDEEFEVDFEAVAGDTIYVLSMIYSTGDSFGHATGHGEVLWAFKSKDVADAAAKAVEGNADGYTIEIISDGGKTVKLSNPGSGYFETVSSIYVESFILNA